jgi:Crp-like helix-turn-helix domain
VALINNNLIEGLPRMNRKHLLSLCESVELASTDVLGRGDTPAREIYFPTGSTVSLSSSPDDLPALEVAMVGSEGMLGAHVALGIATAATYAQVQRPGSALRLTVAAFKDELERSAPLQRSILLYLHVLILQGVCMARCSQFHSVDQRLARWLLMTHDRAHGDTFYVTQAMVARMLGVRRVGITAAAVSLQRRAIIDYVRGQVRILDRKSLETAACACYARDLDSYSMFLH